MPKDTPNYHLDATAGAQLALVVAMKLLLSPYRGNAQAVSALESEMEAMKATLLASVATDYKVQAFDETAEALLSVVREQ